MARASCGVGSGGCPGTIAPLNDDPDLGHAYRAGYSAGRQVVADMGERTGNREIEALRRIMRRWTLPMGPAERTAVVQGIDDGLNGRRPRY